MVAQEIASVPAARYGCTRGTLWSCGGVSVRQLGALVLVIGLGGCAGAPLVSNGLSSDPAVGPVAIYTDPTALPPPVRVRQRRVVKHTSVIRVAEPKYKPEEPAGPDDEPADRAARALDREVHRLENNARAATSSICRGC